jgi:hypothetical protein
MLRLLHFALGRLVILALVGACVLGCFWFADQGRQDPDQDPSLPTCKELRPGEYRGPSIEEFLRMKGIDPADVMDNPALPIRFLG